MYLDLAETAPSRTSSLREAAAAAALAIPPAFPLDATVAVNPFLGQVAEDFPTAAARLRRVAGARIVLPRSEFRAAVRSGTITEADLAAALTACPSLLKPASLADLLASLDAADAVAQAVPTVADLAAAATGTDWPAVVARSFGLWAAGHFDRGQAFWTPAPGQGAFAAWRNWASRDLTPEIAGLTGFCAHVAACPDTAERAIERACRRLGVPDSAAVSLFHRLLASLGGWAQHARYLGWQAEQAGRVDTTLVDLLAIRLVWEEALLAQAPAVAEPWQAALAEHARPVVPSPHDIADAILQDAAERAHHRRLAARLGAAKPAAHRPALQAVFCIDVRSEVFRRALEQTDPGIETFGFAGFFGLPVAHREHGTDMADAHLPVLLTPKLAASSHASAADEASVRIGDRARRAWGRFRQAAVSSFAFVEAAGVGYGGKLLRDALGLGSVEPAAAMAPRFETALSAHDKAALAAGILKAMGLVEGHARLVLLLGHGAGLRNNPHRSAYQCGACGGQSGEVSARLLAALLNDPETRVGLASRGVKLPADTLFVGGLHDTVTDRVALHVDAASADHARDLDRTRAWLERAGAFARTERAGRLPRAGTGRSVLARARNWAETRPEWGLAGCAAFIAAPRAVTAGQDLEGRAFLHSYDWRKDEGFGTLELILTAPVVVASWISLQYYGSAVAPDVFGAGNKLIHNVVGGFGVLQGNGGTLCTGLPWQAVHDGRRLVHAPLRLAVCVEAPTAALDDILGRHETVRHLFDNGWLTLFALQDGRMAHRYTATGWVATT